MNGPTPRLRMFAGPNGSWKSTLKSVLAPELLGVYLNPDEIEENIKRHGCLDAAVYGVQTDGDIDSRLLAFFKQSPLLIKAGLINEAGNLKSTNGLADFSQVAMNSYFASAASDFLRQQLLKQGNSFTLETVMSSPDKVRLLEQAQNLGYRTSLSYIATDAPEINISRVHNRVKQGGHPVPIDKIVSRYHRSLNLLMDAIRHSNRAYVFDNSGHNETQTWLAEITDGQTLEIKADQVPEWFINSVIRKISSEAPEPELNRETPDPKANQNG